MNEFPNRSQQHKIDSDGFALLQYLLPSWYIFRKVDERDYGIDALLELVEGETVTGKFVSLQIKSTENISWNKKDKYKMKIQKSTVNYWFNNNMPVILILVDIGGKSAYFVDVKKHIRKNYDDFLEGNTSFKFKMDNSICQIEGNIIMLHSILRELERETFESTVIDFVNNYSTYRDHLSHYGADFFLTIKDDFFEMTRRIYNILNYLGQQTFAQLNPIDFKTIRENSEKVYKHYYHDSDYELIEWEITEIHLKLQEWFQKVLISLENYITSNEQKYWVEINSPLYYKLINLKQTEIFNC